MSQNTHNYITTNALIQNAKSASSSQQKRETKTISSGHFVVDKQPTQSLKEVLIALECFSVVVIAV